MEFTRCERADGSHYGTGGTCRKGTEVESIITKAGGIRGRVPKNDPKEPLASGLTPMEKALGKLQQFEDAINDPNKKVTERQLEQYGRLSNALDSYKTRRIGKPAKGLLARGKTDRADLDDSKTREKGKQRRKVFGPDEIRIGLLQKKLSKELQDVDKLLRSRRSLSEEEVNSLKGQAERMGKWAGATSAMAKKAERKGRYGGTLEMKSKWALRHQDRIQRRLERDEVVKRG